MPDDPPSPETVRSCAPFGDALEYVLSLQRKWNSDAYALAVAPSGSCRDVSRERPEILEHFPRHRFVAVEMNYFHYMPRPVQLTLVQDRATGETTAHFWEIWFAEGGGAWTAILEGYTAANDQDAISKVTVLARLLAGPCDCQVVSVRPTGSEIVATVTWNEKPWRRIMVGYGEKGTFGELREENAVRE